MQIFFAIMSALQAAIAARAARDRAISALLVAVWGRIARITTRMENLMAQWRAGTLPAARPSRAGETRTRSAVKIPIPSRPAWLVAHVRDAVAFGLQLQHHLSDPEFAAFVAAVPQAGRMLRPLCRMLAVAPLPAVLAMKVRPSPEPAHPPLYHPPAPRPDGVVTARGRNFLPA